MNEFIVFYEHSEYGYYSSTVDDANDIFEALEWFKQNHAYEKVYGIMQVR
ncbi:hypothetical protein ACFOW1_01540 [Parasediminibacterium paludis]|uniref:Phage protein n=1 Tax=Parasediminibacterium paludis TaxID=908966 RepID=A0ABV8PSK1_9BACT